MYKIDIIKALSKTDLTGSKKVFDRIIGKAYNNSETLEEEQVITFISMKHELKCSQDILEKFTKKMKIVLQRLAQAIDVEISKKKKEELLNDYREIKLNGFNSELSEKYKDLWR